MVLDIGGVPNILFDQSRRDELGIASKGNEQYKNYPPTTFVAASPDTNDITLSAAFLTCVDNAITFYGTANLPDNAVISAAIVTGNISDETWWLKRIPLDGSEGSSGTTLATGNFNTEVKITKNNQVNNELYSYTFQTASLDNSDRIYGGRITYTIK